MKLEVESRMMEVPDIAKLIRQGDFLTVAGDESLLRRLPSGNWIGGTIPYFLTDKGGMVSQDECFVSHYRQTMPHNRPRISVYDTNSIAQIAQDAPEHGFSIVILPTDSDVLMHYAENAPEYPDMFLVPLIGWVAGQRLENTQQSAKVCFGPAGGILMDQNAVAMHVPLPASQLASVQMINLFRKISDTPIQFPKTGLVVSECLVNGQPTSLNEHIKEHQIDTSLPLVSDYSGIKINIGIKHICDDGTINLYTPVFAGRTYYFAEPVENFVESFTTSVVDDPKENIAFCTSCVSNYLKPELTVRDSRRFAGPMAFGEIAYQLVANTLVYLTIENAKQ